MIYRRSTVLVILFMFILPQVGSGTDLAVIVNPDNPVRAIEFSQLKKIFKLDKQRWDDGSRTYLVLPEEGTIEKQVLLDRIYKMDSSKLKKFWLAKIFRGELDSFPITTGSALATLLIVAEVENAVAVVAADELDERVIPLVISGKRPGDEGYPLRMPDSPTKSDLGEGP